MSDRDISDFICFFKGIQSENSGTSFVFEWNDKFCFYGDDADLIIKVLPASKLKTMESRAFGALNYVTLTKSNLEKALRHILFILQHRVQIFRNLGAARKPEWRVVAKASPGNLSSIEDILFSDDNSYFMPNRGVMALINKLCPSGEMIGIAYCDPILREIHMCEFHDDLQFSTFQSILVQLSPLECIFQHKIGMVGHPQFITRENLMELIKMHKIAISHHKENFNDENIEQDLNRLLRFDDEELTFRNSMKEEFDMKVALLAVNGVIRYLQLLNEEINFGQYTLKIFKSELYAKVDISCEIGLGLFPQQKTDYRDKNYLFGQLNSCYTSAGERLLMQWIKQPLMDVKKLEERLDAVEAFVKNRECFEDVSKVLVKFIDVELICRKIQRRKATLQDLYKVYQMIDKLTHLVSALKYERGVMKYFRDELAESRSNFQNFQDMMSQTIDFDAIENREYLVKADVDDDLEGLNTEMNKFRTKIDKIQKEVSAELDTTIKQEFVEKAGFLFRITRKEEYRLRNKNKYTTYDTKTSGVRFFTENMKIISDEYSNCKAEYEKVQKKVVDEMIDVSASYIQPLKAVGNLIAWIDVALSLSKAAQNGRSRYNRPKLLPKGECIFELTNCRHPTLENIVRDFIPNDLTITKDKNFYFVTGPNMGGKSTFIRSVALCALMAQMGSFVPCDNPIISISDAFYTRIGACDNPSKAMSTFMYEMVEVKNMVKCATSSSLLIIDEMGRGTSTFDGFGLSWAISKYIAENIKAPCLFATHFHDLTSLTSKVPNVGNLHVDALCRNGEVTFLYKVKPGVCSESFGIHVAKMAAIPSKVIQNAERKLKELEETHISYPEVSAAFSNVPDGDKLVEVLKGVFKVDGKSFEEPMEIDRDPKTKAVELRKTKAEKLLDVLEEMEKNVKAEKNMK